MFYTPDVINSYRQLAFQNPFGVVSNLVVRPADPQNPLPVFTVEDPLAQATRLSTNNRIGMQRNLRDGQVQQWNLALQYLLTKDTSFEAAYHGSKGSHLMSALNYNETNPFPPEPPQFALVFPYPQLGNVLVYESRATANYHALQARIERRFVNGLTFLVSYTFQKTLTDLDSSSAGVAFGAGAGLQTIKNIRGNYGPAVFDRPHRVIGSALYELHFLETEQICWGKSAAAGRSVQSLLSRTAHL
jgi:hypothetical protein